MKNIKTSKNVQQQLEDFKEEALNRLAVYLLPLVLIAIPASVFRTHNETWPNLCNADYVIIAAVFLILLLGNRIPFTAKVYCYMGLGIAEALVELSEFGLVGGGAFAAVFSLMLPLFYLKEWLVQGSDVSRDLKNAHVVVVSVGTQKVGFVVDQLIGQEEVVIKPLGDMLHGTPGMAGATITGDGRITLILDIPGILKHYARSSR